MARAPREEPKPKTRAEAYTKSARKRAEARETAPPQEPEGGFGIDVGDPDQGTANADPILPALDLTQMLFGSAGPIPFNADDDFDKNLVDEIEQRELDECASTLLQEIDRDIDSRQDLDDLIARAIRNLGFDRKSDIRSDYMEGGSGVIHPMMAMAAVDFAARAMREIFPASGPVKTEIVGDDTNEELRAKAERVKKMMNFQTTRGSPEWRPSVDEMCMRFPIVGTAISKITWDHLRRRPRRENVGIMDFLCPLGTDDLERAPRYTHRMLYWDTEVRELMRQGLWRTIDLPAPNSTSGDHSDTKEANQKVVGESEAALGDGRDIKREIYEVHADWWWRSYREPETIDHEEDEVGLGLEPSEDAVFGDDAGLDVYDGDAEASDSGVHRVTGADEGIVTGHDDIEGTVGPQLLPYIITIDKQSRKVLSVRRNWKREDERRKKIIYFKTRAFFPWMGIFGIGLFHLIGGLNVAATGALRALLDSAMVNNMPGGLRLRGSKTTAGRVQVNPMSFAEIDGPPSIDDIRKVAMPLPFNPPSPVLYELMNELKTLGMSFASVAMQELPDNAGEMAVGTLYGMIDEKGAVYSSVHARMHYAQQEELELLHYLDGEYLDNASTEQEFGADLIAYRDDFDGSVNVQPVSDPEIFSQLQRSAKAQVTLQIAVEAKGQGVNVDMRKAFINVAETLNIQNMLEIFPEPEQAVPLDPVGELQFLLAGKPVQAFPGQAHEAHLTFLRATVADPQYAKMLAGIAPQVTALAASHAAALRRDEIEAAIGQPLPPPGQPVAPQIAALIAQAAAAAAVQIAKVRPPIEEMGAGADVAGQAALIAAQAQMKLAEAEIAKVEMQREKTRIEAQISQLEMVAERENLDAELSADLQKIAAELRAKKELERERVASAERIAASRTAVDIAKMQQPKPAPAGKPNGGAK